MAFHESFSDRIFRFAVVVNVRGVKIVKPSFQKKGLPCS